MSIVVGIAILHAELEDPVRAGGPNLAEASQPIVLRKFCSEIQDMVSLPYAHARVVIWSASMKS
jgi:hypothetical protein